MHSIAVRRPGQPSQLRALRLIPLLLLPAFAAGPSGCQPMAAGRTKPAIPADAPVVKVEITAERYRFVPDTIAVPEGSHVVVDLKSLDVEHGFAIDGYAVDVTIPAKRTAVAEFLADRPGTYPFRCSRLCGIGFFRMKGRLIVEPGAPADERPAETPPGPAAGDPEPPAEPPLVPWPGDEPPGESPPSGSEQSPAPPTEGAAPPVDGEGAAPGEPPPGEPSLPVPAGRN